MNLRQLIHDLVVVAVEVGEDSSAFEEKYAEIKLGIVKVEQERDELASRIRELARIISDDGTPDEDLYQSLTEGLPEVAK